MKKRKQKNKPKASDIWGRSKGNWGYRYKIIILAFHYPPSADEIFMDYHDAAIDSRNVAIYEKAVA